jgi:hypothetical protein
MSDWLTMEQHIARKKAEAQALAEQYQHNPPPRRAGNPFAWLSRLLPRRKPAAKPEEAAPRPAFR